MVRTMDAKAVVLSSFIVLALTLGASAGSLFSTKNIEPKLRLEFHAPPDSLNEVREFFVQFARAEGFTVADATPKMPWKDGRPVFNLELRQDDIVTVNIANIVATDQFLVFAYELKPNGTFASVASRLENSLKERWPSTRPYRGS